MNADLTGEDLGRAFTRTKAPYRFYLSVPVNQPLEWLKLYKERAGQYEEAHWTEWRPKLEDGSLGQKYVHMCFGGYNACANHPHLPAMVEDFLCHTCRA